MSQQLREAFMHDVDLGKPLDQDAIARLIQERRADPIVPAILQLLRTQSATLERTGRQPPKHNPDWRPFHDGAADGLEEVFWLIHAATLPHTA